MDNRLSFTQGWVDRLQPTGKREQFYDLGVRGLLLDLMESGSKIFRYRRKIESKDQKFTIGDTTKITLEEARDAAEILSADLIKGCDFKQDRQDIRAELTLLELADFYFEQYAKDRCTTANEMQKDFKRWFAAELPLKLSAISTQWIQVRLNKLNTGGHPHRANKARDHIRAIFNWGIKHKLCKENPAKDTDGFKVQSRERIIMPEEFGCLFDAILNYPDDRLRDLFLICLYTGQRVGNIQAMRWDQINFKLNTWTIPRTKNGKSHTIELTAAAIEVLQERRNKMLSHFVFPGGNLKNGTLNVNTHITEPKKAWIAIKKSAGIYDITIHDLRRTMGSYMNMEGAETGTIMQQLGHQSIQAAAVYNRSHIHAAKLAADKAIEKMHQLRDIKFEVS